MEVIYTGLHQTPDQIVAAAVQEDVDVVGLSILSGAHIGLTEKTATKLREAGMGHVLLLVGGTIPQEDGGLLRSKGAAGVFPAGSSFDEIVDFIRRNAPRRSIA